MFKLNCTRQLTIVFLTHGTAASSKLRTLIVVESSGASLKRDLHWAAFSFNFLFAWVGLRKLYYDVITYWISYDCAASRFFIVKSSKMALKFFDCISELSGEIILLIMCGRVKRGIYVYIELCYLYCQNSWEICLNHVLLIAVLRCICGMFC